MAKTVEIKKEPRQKQPYFAVRVTLGEIPKVKEEWGYDAREIKQRDCDPIYVVGNFCVRKPADSLSQEINKVLHGAK